MRAIASLLFLLTTLSVWAQDETALSLSLDEAIQYAVENNYESQNVKLDALINDKIALERVGVGLPDVSAGIVYQHYAKLPVSIIPEGSNFGGQIVPDDIELEFGVPHNVNLDFSVSQILVDGRYFIGLKANKTLKAMSQEQIALTESEVKNNTAKAYYGVLVAEKRTGIVEKNIATIEKILSDTKQLYENGFSEELDVDRLELQLANMESTLKSSTQQHQLSLNILKYSMGLDGETGVKLTDDLEKLLSSSPIVESNAFNPGNRAEYKLLKHQLQMRIYDAKQTALNYAPSIVAFAGYGFNAQRQKFNIFDFSQNWYQIAYWGIELKMSLFDGFKNGAKYQQKKLDQLKIDNQIESFELQANLEVNQRGTDYKTALEEFDNQNKNLALAEKIYNKVQVMYKEGLSSSMELADAEKSLVETQSNYINSMFDLLVAKSELEKALGSY